MNTQILDPEMQRRVQAELKPGEFLKWSAQPDPKRYAKSGMLIWIFFIPWTAFALFWMAAASGFQMPSFDHGWSFFPLFGLPFVLIGIGGLSSPLWKRNEAKFMVYAITDQRAFIIQGKKTIKVLTYSPSDINAIERSERKDGSGDLFFHSRTRRDSDGDMQTDRHGFIAVSNVRHVHGLIEELAANA